MHGALILINGVYFSDVDISSEPTAGTPHLLNPRPTFKIFRRLEKVGTNEHFGGFNVRYVCFLERSVG